VVRSHRYAVGAKDAPGFTFAEEPTERRVAHDGEVRSAVVTSGSGWTWRGRVPKRSTLHVGIQSVKSRDEAEPELQLRLRIQHGGSESVLVRDLATLGRGSRWNDFDFDLGELGGDRAEISASWSARDSGEAPTAIAWSPVSFSVAGASTQRAAPDVVFILVDTLRADHLSSYGYGRPTTPEIDRRLADRGVVFEQAHSQAPWTMPSIASIFSSRPPMAIWASEGLNYRLRHTGPLLAEQFAALGYDTAAFVANPILRPGNGYDRGFDTYYSPAGPGAFDANAGDLHERLEPWLRSRGPRPFFLYVHYLDPHSPYASPDLVDGRSSFYPDYHGRLVGSDVQGLLLGKVKMRDPVDDLAHLTALYDSEIVFVDRHIGRLLDLLEARAGQNLLVALTADHGEELYDHQGWDHSQTLYEELIHVPLLLRWEGHLPGGTRVREPVQLLDVAPTLVAAAGGETPPAWSGADLLRSIRGESRRRGKPSFAERVVADDPFQAAVRLGSRKLILFNRRQAEGVPAKGEKERILKAQRLRRLAARELYDLASDPGEAHNLADEPVAGRQELEELLHRHLDRSLPGLRVVARGLPAGSSLEAVIELDRPPDRWQPLFLGASDHVELEGARVRLELIADDWVKGLLLEGDELAVRSIRLLSPATPTTATRILVGNGLDYRGGPVAATTLLSPAWPLGVDGACLGVWSRTATEASTREESLDPETLRRLRALGYID